MPLPLVIEWHRDSKGYRIAPAKPRTGNPNTIIGEMGSDRVVPLGGDPIPYCPLKTPKKKKPVYLQFAEVDSAEALLNFVNQFGLLTTRWEDRHRGEAVEILLSQAEELRWLVKLLTRGRSDGAQVKLSRAIGITLVLDAKKKLQFEASNLLWGLWLQAVSRHVEIRECLHCGQPFEAGPGSEPWPGRRVDALYCSPEHQKRDKSLRRSLK